MLHPLRWVEQFNKLHCLACLSVALLYIEMCCTVQLVTPFPARCSTVTQELLFLIQHFPLAWMCLCFLNTLKYRVLVLTAESGWHVWVWPGLAHGGCRAGAG